MNTKIKKSIFLIFLTCAVFLITISGCYKKEHNYITAPIKKGNISQKITASGTINPISTVIIGTQVSGIIDEIYVDYNSKVKKGELLAQIDPQTFEAAVDQKQAALDIAKAEYYKKLNSVCLIADWRDFEIDEDEMYWCEKELDEEAEFNAMNSKIDIALGK
jgi:multidrug efflux pump subunit AcrA (membrane-fusion protein)